MTPETIQKFIVAIESRLQPSGYLMLWVDKYLANECAWRHWFPDVSAFQSVDLMHWNKGRIGMGRRLRCQSEYLVILQKRPIRGKGTWSDHSLPDTWTEDSSRDRHPHAKPLQLLQRLIKATTKRGELVVDPAAGGFGVLDACLATGRTFLGCDLEG